MEDEEGMNEKEKEGENEENEEESSDIGEEPQALSSPNVPRRKGTYQLKNPSRTGCGLSTKNVGNPACL